jgi:sugar/nucleoside kinase (ribokinase family)
MANTFKNRTLRAVGTSPVDVGAVVASSTETTLIGMTLANITSGVISVTATLNDGSNTTHIVKDAPIPTGGSLILLGGDQKVVLMTGDKIIVTSNTASSVDVIMSFLEIT